MQNSRDGLVLVLCNGQFLVTDMRDVELKTCAVLVPEGAVAGDAFTVTTEWGGNFTIQCPEGSKGGDVIAVDLPTFESVAASIDEMERVKQFVDELTGSGCIEAFLVEHASAFADLKQGSAEMPLHYQEIHLKFVGLIETLLEEFVTAQGLDIESFIGLVERSGSESREQLLKAVDALTDFHAFLAMMREIKEGKPDTLASEFDQNVAISS